MSGVPKWWNPKLASEIEVQLTAEEFRLIKQNINEKHRAGKISTRAGTSEFWEGDYGRVTFWAHQSADLPLIASSIAKVLKRRQEATP